MRSAFFRQAQAAATEFHDVAQRIMAVINTNMDETAKMLEELATMPPPLALRRWEDDGGSTVT